MDAPCLHFFIGFALVTLFADDLEACRIFDGKALDEWYNILHAAQTSAWNDMLLVDVFLLMPVPTDGAEVFFLLQLIRAVIWALGCTHGNHSWLPPLELGT